jgi:hypothetical protein
MTRTLATTTTAARRPLICASFLVLAASVCGACGGNDPGVITPYQPEETHVVGTEGDAKEFPNPDSCELAGCATVVEECGKDGAADVVVDAQGNRLDIICYGQNVVVSPVPVAPVDSVDAGNNTVVVVDGAADGVDVTGDVVISGNSAIVYGEGPDVSIIGGTLAIEKNNAKIRGVRIQGDVVIDKNNTKMLFCVIEGNLEIHGNNTTIAGCDVYGSITVTGVNTVLVQNRIAGEDGIVGKNLTCVDNVRFDDENGDLQVDDVEIGAPLDCD